MTAQALATDHNDELTRWVARTRGPAFALIWLPILLVSPVLSNAMTGNAVTLSIYLVIAVVYVVTVVVAHSDRPQWMGELCTAGLTALIVIQFVFSQGGQGFLYPLLAIAAATAIRRRMAFGFVMGLSISGTFAEGFATMSLSNALQFGFATVMAGASTYLIRCLADLVGQLRTTRSRLAALAVVEERQRFSRDLHDLLGHTLSVIVVKSEAIRRFAEADPKAAVTHARDIEDIGRTALTDVRQAVAGYREIRLSEELKHATDALADAGVKAEVTNPLPSLDRATDTLFAWVAREAATNVLRHAHASTCSMTVAVRDRTATLDISDNGRGANGSEWGSGLNGLRERAERLGGRVDILSDNRGFAVRATVPMREDQP